MAILLNDNLNVALNKPVDNRFGPYTSTAAAVAAIPSYQRYTGLTVGIVTSGVVTEHWFKDGVLDLNLVVKTSGGAAVNIAEGKSTYWTATEGQTTFTTINGYSTNNADAYLVSVGAQDQIPTLNYTITANGGTGALLLSSGAPGGTIVSIRALSGETTSVNATALQGRAVSSVAPTEGQVLAWNATTSTWEAITIDTNFGGTATFNTVGTTTLSVPSSARWARLQATAGNGNGVSVGQSVKVNNVVVVAGTTGAGSSIDIAYNLTPFAGGTLGLEITAGTGSATITITW